MSDIHEFGVRRDAVDGVEMEVVLLQDLRVFLQKILERKHIFLVEQVVQVLALDGLLEDRLVEEQRQAVGNDFVSFEPLVDEVARFGENRRELLFEIGGDDGRSLSLERCVYSVQVQVPLEKGKQVGCVEEEVVRRQSVFGGDFEKELSWHVVETRLDVR